LGLQGGGYVFDANQNPFMGDFYNGNCDLPAFEKDEIVAEGEALDLMRN